MEEDKPQQENPETENIIAEEQETPAPKSFFNSWKGGLLLGVVAIIRGALGGTLAPAFLVLGVVCILYAIYSYAAEQRQ